MSVPECNLQELVESHIKCIHEHIKGGAKSFTATLLVESIEPLKSETEKGLDVIIIGTIDDNRFEVMEQLGAKYYNEERVPLGIAFAGEAWMSNQTHCKPSESDDRQEVIFIAAKTINGKAIMQCMPFKRDKDGNIIETAFIERSGGAAHTNLLDHFFRGFFKDWSGR